MATDAYQKTRRGGGDGVWTHVTATWRCSANETKRKSGKKKQELDMSDQWHFIYPMLMRQSVHKLRPARLASAV